MRFMEIIQNNFWAKLIALILAIATWFYVFDMINSDSAMQGKESMEELFERYDFVVRSVPVKAVFVGKSPQGYRVAFDRVKVDPPEISIFGPEEVVGRVDELSTSKINLGEYTRSTKLSLGLQSNMKYFQMKDKVVDVYLPVEAIEMDSVGGLSVEKE